MREICKQFVLDKNQSFTIVDNNNKTYLFNDSFMKIEELLYSLTKTYFLFPDALIAESS